MVDFPFKIQEKLAEHGLRLVSTDDGGTTLFSSSYDQTFHSSSGAKVEASLLYLEASGLSQRILEASVAPAQEKIVVLDIGLGLAINGLNLLNHWMLQNEVARSIKLISLEKNADLLELISDPEISSCWMESWSGVSSSIVQRLCKSEKLFVEVNHPNSPSKTFSWQIIVENALISCRALNETIDVFWQDAFSPPSNEELWTKEWFETLFGLAKNDAVLVTYSVSGKVKRNLKDAGWQVEKFISGTRKREWLRARKL
jgi:tRNA U34 5-methylaminomethyl-2-thiouridine-forming methyltransferase MnmC